MSYGFASYKTIDEAHGVAYLARNKHPEGTNIKLAPKPNDLIWKNLPMTGQERRWQRLMNNLWMALLTLLWVAPNALIAVFLANLSNLGKVWGAFQTELNAHSKIWAAVQGILSPAITSLFYYFLPIFFRRLSMRAGDLSKTSRERHVIAKLYSFFVFNNLVVFSLFAAVWQYVAAVLKARQDDPDIFHALQKADFLDKFFPALCSVSPFWITWLLQRNLGAAIDLSQIVNLAWGSISRTFKSPTPRELIEMTAPPPFDYASYYNYFLFYSTIALCFGTLQPIVFPVTAFYFAIDAGLKKYLLM
jgi:calcium permeable stress-gated cation channel